MWWVMEWVTWNLYWGYGCIESQQSPIQTCTQHTLPVNPHRFQNLWQSLVEVTFKTSNLVQVYRSDLNYMFKTERKLLPKFSGPWQVISQNGHSYKLEMMEGFPTAGKFSLHQLQLFIPRKGQSWRECRQQLRRNGEDGRKQRMRWELVLMRSRILEWIRW